MQLKARPLSAEAFAPYGTYLITGECDEPKESMIYLADVSAIRLNNPTAGVGVLYVDPQEAVMEQMEMHKGTDEGWIVLNGDCVASFGTPSDDPNTAEYAAFLIPAGTVVSIKPGIWHFAPIACGDVRTTVLAILPPNTPENDIVVLPLDEPMTIAR